MWRDLQPRRMRRIVIVAPVAQLDRALLGVGRAGVVELDVRPDPDPVTPDAEERMPAGVAAQVARVAATARCRGEVAGLAGWTPEAELEALSDRLHELGATAVPVPPPAGVQPPTQLHGHARGRSFDLLVETYATVPYRDLDPAVVAGVAYVAMFGMMFGDVGHGLLLLVGGLLARSGRLPGTAATVAGLRRSWPFLAGGGLASMAFGLLYGEAFGPTGLVPTLWLNPLESPVPVLVAAVLAGSVLIAGAYGLGTANRVREGGWGYALYARTGVAGSLVFTALAGFVAGFTWGRAWLVALAVVLSLVGLGLAFVGLLVESGGGAAGVVQSVVELVDLVVRLGSNVVSFARLAAFGLTHAALGAVVWQGTTGLWSPGPGMAAAVLLLVVGNIAAFALEALVAGIQALRLEYYELFSRVFTQEGRPFRPWRLPASAVEGPLSQVPPLGPQWPAAALPSQRGEFE